MNTLNNYISEKLFTDIDSQMDETTDNYIKNKLYEILDQIILKDDIEIKNGIIDISSKGRGFGCSIFIDSNKKYSDIVKLLGKDYKFGHIDYCYLEKCKINQSPKFFKDTEFISFKIDPINTLELSNWNISISKTLNIDCGRINKIKNFKVKALKNIKLVLKFTDYNDEKRIEDIINGIIIDKPQYVDNIVINYTWLDLEYDEDKIKHSNWLKTLANKYKEAQLYIRTPEAVYAYNYEDIK